MLMQFSRMVGAPLLAMLFVAGLGLAAMAAEEDAHKPAAGAAADKADPHKTDAATPPHGEKKHGEAAHAPPMPLSYDPDLAIFTAVIFLLLLLVLGKFAWGPIIDALDKRENSLADKLEEADRHQREARALLAEYEKKLAAAGVQVDEMIAKGRREAEAQAQRIVDDASEVARSEKTRAVAAIHAAKEEALRQLAEKSVDTAFGLAGKVLGREIRPADHSALVGEALAQFPGKQGA